MKRVKILFTYVTCKNAAEAKKIGRALVKKKLAACAVVVPKAESFYFLGGKLHNTKEALLFLKSSAESKAGLEKTVRAMHSYEVPCILFFKAECSKDYGKWLNDAVE